MYNLYGNYYVYLCVYIVMHDYLFLKRAKETSNYIT